LLAAPAFVAAPQQHRAEQTLLRGKAVGHAALCLAQATLAFGDDAADHVQRQGQRDRHAADREGLAEQGEFHGEGSCAMHREAAWLQDHAPLRRR
jgi:hypothetical protein